MRRALGILAVAASMTALIVGCGTQTSSANPSTLATNQTNQTTANTTSSGQGQTNNTTASTQNVALKQQNITLTVLPGGRLGPDGKMHDTFSPANWTLTQGVPATITVYNYDNMKHSVTSSALGLNLQAKPSPKNGVPGVTTITFTPTKTGDFTWQCIDPCDTPNQGWAMSHKGFMEGTIHVVAPQKVQRIYLTIKDGLQYAKADGKLHDSYSPADISVQAGIPVEVTVANFDSGEHSFTSPALGLNQVFKGASKAGDATTSTFTFTPTKAGKFHWQCDIQCDGNGWAMTHDGYMSGYVTVTS